MTGNKKVDMIISTLAVVSTVAALGMYVFTEMVYKRPLPSDELEELSLRKDVKELSFPETYQLEKLTINLQSRTSRLRYLDVLIHFIPFNSEQNTDFESKKDQIHDQIITLVSYMTPEELNSVSGKLLLESRIQKSVNALWKEPHVKEVLFSKFVVQ